MSFITEKLTLTAFKNQFQSYPEVVLEYDSNTTYIERNIFVCDLSNSKIFKNKIYNNINNPLTDDTKWEEITGQAIVNEKLDIVLSDTMIQSYINNIEEDLIDEKVVLLPDEILKIRLYNLWIAHNLYKNKLRSLGKTLPSNNTSGLILTSSSDGENSGSGEVISFYKNPLFIKYKDSVFGVEYFNLMGQISNFHTMKFGGIGSNDWS
jgi:hypothetical protein